MINKKLGFTLIETLVVLGIIAIVGGLIFGFGRNIFIKNSSQQKTFNNESEAKVTLSKLTTELRIMSQSNTGTYPIEAVSTSSLIFYSDINKDGLKERVRYFRDIVSFKKGIVSPSEQPYVYDLTTEKISTVVFSLASSTAPIFSYYDYRYGGSSTTPPLTSPVEIKNIRLIRVDLYVGSGVVSEREPATIYFTSQVSPRNLKDNLW